jgi:ATP-dependent Clp protease protease subunit
VNKYWSLKKTGKTAELMIYGVIDDMNFWVDEVTPKDIDKSLKAMNDVDEIVIRINSPGGNVFAGMAIYTMLNRHEAKKTVYVDGLAASMASIIALVGDKVIMPKGAMMMIHRPMGTAYSANADKMRKNAELLDKIEGEMIDIYSSKSGIGVDDLKALLDAETWYTAEEAVAAGFADEIEDTLQIAACIRDDKAVINGVEMNWNFKNAPKLPNYEASKGENIESRANARQRSLELKFKEV